MSLITWVYNDLVKNFIFENVLLLIEMSEMYKHLKQSDE